MPHRSSTGSFIKWCPRNASLNVHSEEVTPGCWPSRQIGKEKAISETGQEEKRLRWAKEHRHWTEEDWKRVLWTDESKLEVFGSHWRTFVRRRTSEKMLEECLTPSVKHVGGNVMVWACFGAGKVGDLYKVEGILNKEGYHSIFPKPCHTLWAVFDWSQFSPTIGQWPIAKVVYARNTESCLRTKTARMHVLLQFPFIYHSPL